MNDTEVMQRSQSVCALANKTLALICRQVLLFVKLLLQTLSIET
jgi:hypothetical protein